MESSKLVILAFYIIYFTDYTTMEFVKVISFNIYLRDFHLLLVHNKNRLFGTFIAEDYCFILTKLGLIFDEMNCPHYALA